MLPAETKEPFSPQKNPEQDIWRVTMNEFSSVHHSPNLVSFTETLADDGDGDYSVTDKGEDGNGDDDDVNLVLLMTI